MAEAGDEPILRGKRKAITTLLPYAAWLERDGRPGMLDAFLRAARALGFMWYHPTHFSNMLSSKASPRAVVLASPYIPWRSSPKGVGLVQRWAAAVSAAPHTEEVAQSVVDALLRIASHRELSPHITLDAWSWLKKRPSLPFTCTGRRFGTYSNNVKAVRELKDIEVLKSYLVLVWSEWDAILDEGFDEMHASVCWDFGGIGMGHHRADLIHRLDHILGQLDRGIEHLKQRVPGVDGQKFRKMKNQYGKLRYILLEANARAIAGTSYRVTTLLSILIQTGTHRISHDVYVHASPPIPIGSRP